MCENYFLAIETKYLVINAARKPKATKRRTITKRIVRRPKSKVRKAA